MASPNDKNKSPNLMPPATRPSQPAAPAAQAAPRPGLPSKPVKQPIRRGGAAWPTAAEAPKAPPTAPLAKPAAKRRAAAGMQATMLDVKVPTPGAAAPPPAAVPVAPPPASPATGPANAPAQAPAADLSDTMVGVVIEGRYRILAPLAAGGMGSVYLAEHTGLKRRVAVKVLISEEDEMVERFQREAISLAEVAHPAIVEIHDFTASTEEIGKRGCLVMAFIDGLDLGDYLEQHPQRRLPPEEVIELFLPVVSALVELHANGIIHRDIKPPNLVRFVRADGRPGVKLVDFGIARRQLDPGMTAAGLILGTPPYLPPESFIGDKHTPLADIYSLGCTLFEMLTGDPPFADEKITVILQRTLHEEVVFPAYMEGSPMAELLGDMLKKVARERPDALQVLHRLEAIRSKQQARALAKKTGAAAPAPPGPQNPSAPLDASTALKMVPAFDEQTFAGQAKPAKPSILPWILAVVLPVLSFAAAWFLWGRK